MLGPLKRKFTIVVTTLVGLVLTGVLAASLWFSWLAKSNAMDQVLDHYLEGSLSTQPAVDMRPEGAIGSGVLVTLLEVSPTGIVLATNNPSVSLDADDLEAIVSMALGGASGDGRVDGLDVAWKSRRLANGNLRIAMLDASGYNRFWKSQVTRSLVAFVLSLGAVTIIAMFLADWVVQPIQEAFDRQRRFVADASHELKTPLAVILANSDILLRSDALLARDRRWVESTQDEAQRMRGLVVDLLQLAKADEGVANPASPALSTREMDLSELVESACLEFDAIAFDRGCAIKTEIVEGLHVQGDPDWTSRLVRILVDNACKYACRGSEVTVRLAPERHRRLRLSVTNQGETILPGDLRHVFDRFYRSDRSRTRTDSPGGFGLGLAIAKGIAEAQGGSIAATSDRAGTTFFVILPQSPHSARET
ncbi:cell wall metabolism sensor histidine kinase WalK [Olsenella sp. HMSC062G07]|uniref:sensor histidine kinase n=1 Tax=Olsenella sp. HMSC062G07 TaxID=1739330 RepID=UPI0008A5C92A|nr:HAMP domain-containing sensor histidine kinase [Olsenella sp. HMSC062G07]OFK24300.1 hypothetical protein HMPREF2826_07630 [Olsenella sp. HMSC062G07]